MNPLLEDHGQGEVTPDKDRGKGKADRDREGSRQKSETSS